MPVVNNAPGNNRQRPGAVLREQQSKYNFLGQGIQGTFVPPDDANGRIVRLINARVNGRLDYIHKREGSETLPNSAASGRGFAIGHITQPSPSSSIPYFYDLLYKCAGTAYFYDVNAETQTTLVPDSTLIGAFSLLTERPGSVLTGLGTRTYLISGTPSVYLPSVAGTIFKLGTPAPAAGAKPGTTFAVSTASTTLGYDYVVTYEHKQTGYESDYSNSLTARATIASNQLERVSFAAGGTNYITRIYRTTDGGSAYYLDYEVDGATGTILNSDYAYKTDNELSAASPGDARGTRAMPPATAHIAVFHNNRLFIADNNTLYISNGYNGSDANLAYFDVENLQLVDQPITAMHSFDNQLFIWTATKLYSLQGQSPSEYRLNQLSSIGCISPSAVASNSQDMVWVSEEGIHSYRESLSNISRPVDHIVQKLLSAPSASLTLASMVWNPHTQQFIFNIVNDRPAQVVWVDAVDATDVFWEDDVDSSGVIWQDSTIFSGNAQSAVLAWSPSMPDFAWVEYRFNQLVGGAGYYPLLLSHPHASSEAGSYQQRHDYLLFYNATTDESSVIKTFIDGAAGDDNVVFDAVVEIGPIIPGEQTDSPKFIRAISFGSVGRDPTYGQTATLYYWPNGDDPYGEGLDGGYLVSLPTGYIEIPFQERLQKVLPSNTMKWFYFRLIDQSSLPGKAMLRDFTVWYRERRYRDYTTY